MKTLMYSLLAGLAGSLRLLSCFTSRQSTSLPVEDAKGTDAAKVYILRTSLVGAAIPFAVYSDSTKIGKIGVGSYLCWQVEPGNHVLTIASETKKHYPFVAKAGESYYFKAIPQIGIILARAKLKPIPVDEALAELAQARKPTLKQAAPN